MIEIRTLESGAAIAFPFALKDDFRRSFPSASWDPKARVWKVGPRSVRRLEEWTAKVRASGAVEALFAAEEVELGETELERLTSSLADITMRCGSLEALRDRRMAQLARMSEIRNQLAAAQDKHARLETEAKTLRMELVERAAGVCDLVAARNAMRHMLSAWGRFPKSYARGDFERAQDVVQKACDALAKAGLRFEGLSRAASANWNRKDRDMFVLDLGEIEVIE